MSKKCKTKAEKEYMREVSELGCLICIMPAEIHHCGTHMGGGRDHSKIIPLCPTHHRVGGYGIAIHAGKKRWEENYDTEKNLLISVSERLGLINQEIDGNDQ